MASLVDTNVLVYRCDPRDLAKREAARDLLRRGQASGELRVAHQALVEFINAVTRLRSGTTPILGQREAIRQAELFMVQFPILYPDAPLFRMALRGMVTYTLSWFDAHMWAYAEHYGLEEILSEDFEHGRLYGSVRARNPFLGI